jgi:hypothetical protein
VITDLGSPIFSLMFCKQADSRFHHRGYSLVVVDITEVGWRAVGF